MTRDDIAAMFSRREEAWRRRDAAALASDHAEDGTVESPLAGGKAAGREAIEKLYATFFRAFPDMKVELEQLLIDGEDVAMLASMSGADTGGFMGLPPSGRPLNVRAAFFYKVRGGAIVSERRVYDFTGVLIQVGAIKAKPV